MSSPAVMPATMPFAGPSSKGAATTPARIWLLPLASAALLYVAFFPVAFGWIAWVALLPWLFLVRSPGRPHRLYLAAYLGGLAFFLAALQWMRVADPRMYYTWIVLSVYCAAYFPILLAVLRRLERRTCLPLVLTFPVAWVALELTRWGLAGGLLSLLTGSHQHDVPGGFSWYFLGHTQHDFLELIQVADLAGVYAISFLVAAANVVLFEILHRHEGIRRLLAGPDAVPRYAKKHLLFLTLPVAGLTLAMLGYGIWRLSEETTTEGPRLALLQGNMDQRLRNVSTGLPGQARDRARQRMADHFADLAGVASARRPDLIVWPETSFPGTWEELAPGRPTMHCRELADRMRSRWHTPVLLGMNAAIAGEDGKVTSRNSAILLDAEGQWRGRYDKVHRVPFGEYIPLRNWLPLLQRLAPYDYDYSVEPGEEFTKFTLTGGPQATTFGVMICYEDTDPAMARPYAQGTPVDFLLNISNDGWFDGTCEHDQHLALCRFRAVETRRAVARAVNMGISAIIDSNGRVLAPQVGETEEIGEGDERVTIPIWKVPQEATSLPVSEWARYKQVAGILLARIPIDQRGSFYARWGDVFALSCAGGLVLTLAATMRRRKEGNA